MKRPFVVVLLLLALGGWAHADNAALVTKLTGNVTLDGKPVKLAQKLPEKSKLMVPAGASVSVVYMAGATQESLTGPGSLTIGANRALASDGKLVTVAGPGQLKGGVQSNHLKAGLASVRGSEDFELISARFLPDGQLELVWEAKEGLVLDQKFFISLKSGASESEAKLLYELDDFRPAVAGRKVTTVLALKPNSFTAGVPALVRIEHYDDGAVTVNSEMTWMMVLSPEQQEYFDKIRAWAKESPAGDPSRYLYLAQLSKDWIQPGVGIQAAEEADKRTNERDTSIATLLYELLLLDDQKDRMNALKPRLEAVYTFDGNYNLIPR